MPKYNVVGQVFMADGFNYTIEAPTSDAAATSAKQRAWEERWKPEIQEVSIQSISEESPIIAKLTQTDIYAGLALLEAAMDSDPNAKMWEGKPLRNVWAALASLINDTDAIELAKDEGVTA